MPIKKSFDELYGIWQKFINGDDNLSGLSTEVAFSWKRSRAFGVDPFAKSPLVDEKVINELQRKNKNLIEVVSPFVALVRGFIHNTGFMVTLVDKDGFILDVKGDRQALEEAKLNMFCIGANRSEKVAGTNAISLALIENKPIQIVGPEHFRRDYHNWTCSAAPIHDTQGNTVGVLNWSGHCSLVHKHTLGMVISLVNAIEREFCIREKNAVLRVANERLKAVIDSISEGVVALDKNGNIVESNAKLQKMFHLSKSELHGTNVAEVFKKPLSLLDVLANGREFFDREENIAGKVFSISSMTTGRKIVNDQGEVVGAVGIIKERKEVYRLVNRLAGAKAVFTFQSIVHGDQQMAKTISMAEAVAQTDTRVLLEGESGTGKELFAQAIHNASQRQSGPFVAVNCSAIPRELIESELFGYVEGAFTGAKKGGKPGKFELADGGTLFLDEVNSMPLDMQVKLLRVLQQNEVTRLGGEQAVPINVRIIAASNKSLEELVKEGHFRLDLFYRLGVVVLRIPPLRDRIKDIPMLFCHLLKKITEQTGKSFKYSLDELTPLLCSYDWPGNVRELENFIERAAVLAHDGEITAEHFPDKIKAKVGEKTGGPSNNYLAIKEREAIGKVLELYNGNISKAARSLGISRNTLYTKIKAYGLEVG